MKILAHTSQPPEYPFILHQYEDKANRAGAYLVRFSLVWTRDEAASLPPRFLIAQDRKMLSDWRSRLFSAAQLPPAETVHRVVVHHTHRLHVGIANGWANELKTALFQVPTHGL